VVELAFLHGALVDGRMALAAEVRQRMDILGLTQKGKRDLRWRVPSEAPAQETDGTVTVTDGTVTAINEYRRAVSGVTPGPDPSG